MSQSTSDNLYKDFETGRWKVRKFCLPNANEYLLDIENITWAATGLIEEVGVNRFFDEASQMIANSVFLFQEGFFDAAFYSLRQSIEISIGTLYLTANPEKLSAWKKLEPGFESGKMADFLRNHESVFKEMRTKMADFFDNIRIVQRKTNKYIHKQGFVSFYTTQRYTWSDHREDKIYQNIILDFEEIIKVAIGAVAMYRLAIDPLPVILMDEELVMRSGDLITVAYSDEFVNKYIELNNIELYKQTGLYQDYKSYFMLQERQNDAIFDIVHWQIIDRGKIAAISEQIHLLSFTDRLAVAIMMCSTKIPQVYIEGFFHYTSDIKAKHTDIVIGNSYYEDFFTDNDKGNTDYNVLYKKISYLSRIKIKDSFSYIESNEPLNSTEIEILKNVAKIFEDEYIRQESQVKKWLSENGINIK